MSIAELRNELARLKRQAEATQVELWRFEDQIERVKRRLKRRERKS
jgi:septal ring factor EnvC (AmiA/AmiB activator)